MFFFGEGGLMLTLSLCGAVGESGWGYDRFAWAVCGGGGEDIGGEDTLCERDGADAFACVSLLVSLMILFEGRSRRGKREGGEWVWIRQLNRALEMACPTDRPTHPSIPQ